MPDVPDPPAEQPSDASRTSRVDVAVALTWYATRAAASVWRETSVRLGPVAQALARPPGVPARFQPGHWISVLGTRGASVRETTTQDVDALLDRLVPAVAEEMLRHADLTTLITRHVDLDGVVAAVDLERAIDRVDVNEIAAKVDLDAAAGRIDVNSVAERVDVDSVLDRMDLTAVVLQRVDLEALVNAVLARIDLAGLAQEVIEAIDLPEIIRESSGAMASDTVRGARMQGIAADDAVGRVVDRLLLRRSGRSNVDRGADGAPDEARSRLPAQGVPRHP